MSDVLNSLMITSSRHFSSTWCICQ